LNENKFSQLPPCPSPVLCTKENELSSKQQQGNTKEEEQGIKDGLTFPHIVFLLWEGADPSNFSVGEGIGIEGRRPRGCTTRNVDRVLVEFSKEKN
jgi:hypothetical protein